MLRTSFHGHTNVVARTELFNPDWNRNEGFDDATSATRLLAKHVFGPQPSQVGAVGFVLHRSGARFGNWPDLWDLLERDTGLHVISLRRCDLLRRYLSFCLMRERNQSGFGERFVPAPRAYRAEDLRKEFERTEQEIAACDARFASHPLLPVTYEQLCMDYEPVLRRVQVFLGVRPRPVRPATARNASPVPEDLITNFDALTKTFESTRWAWFFQPANRPTDRLSARGEATLAW
jgi:hypothetical protein